MTALPAYAEPSSHAVGAAMVQAKPDAVCPANKTSTRVV